MSSLPFTSNVDNHALMVYDSFWMRETFRREAYIHRPMKACVTALGEIRFNPHLEFLIETDEFINLIRNAYGFDITRRTLQLYSSPQHRLLPPPIHKGGHKSYYLNPEHTQRLAVILHLSTKLFMPLKAIRTLLRGYPARHYDILLKDVFTTKDLDQIVAHFGEGFEVKDFLFHKIVRVMRAMDESEEDESLQDSTARHRVLVKMTHEFERWLESPRREKVELFLKMEPKL